MRRNKRRDKSPPFVMLEKRELLGNKAWKELKGSSVKVYIKLREKAFGHISEAVKSEIKLPYSLIVTDTGLCRQTVRKAIIELENLGFIELKEQGGLKSGGRSANVYSLSKRFIEYGTDGFKKGCLKEYKGVTHVGFGKAWKDKKNKSQI